MYCQRKIPSKSQQYNVTSVDGQYTSQNRLFLTMLFFLIIIGCMFVETCASSKAVGCRCYSNMVYYSLTNTVLMLLFFCAGIWLVYMEAHLWKSKNWDFISQNFEFISHNTDFITCKCNISQF